MLKDIIQVTPLDGYRLHIRFEDGVEGEIDIEKLIPFKGVFSPLKDREFFTQFRVNPELGIICWPNEADLDSDVLYAKISGEPIPAFDQTSPHFVSEQNSKYKGKTSN